MSEEDLSYIFQALAHETRRKIVELLAEEGPLNFTEIMNRLGISETGTFGFHIKRMEDLLEKTDDGKYKLSDLGLVAYNIIKYAKEGRVAKIEEEKPSVEEVKVFRYLVKIIVDRSLLERYSKVGFDYVGTVVFTEDIDPELFKKKVLFFRGVGTIVVPKNLVKIAYSLMEEYCGDIVGYEGELPQKWLEEKKPVKHLDIYGGDFILTKERLEKAKREGFKYRIENYGRLIIERDVTPELFDETVFSINSYGEIYAPRALHKIILNKVESVSGQILDLSEFEKEI